MSEPEMQDNAVPDGSTPVPELLERGRYALTGMPDGSWVITRAVPLCERCASCGCGEQDQLPPIPQFAVQVFTGQANGHSTKAIAAAQKVLAKMLGRSGG